MKQEELEIVVGSMPYVYCGCNVKFVLTGTFLLSIFKLIDKYSDVDILVIDSDKEFWSELLNKYEDKVIDNSMWYCGIKIKIDGIIYNLIKDDNYDIESDSTNICIDSDCVYFDSIQHALEAKHRLNRDKDKAHFVDINKRLQLLIK